MTKLCYTHEYEYEYEKKFCPGKGSLFTFVDLQTELLRDKMHH